MQLPVLPQHMLLVSVRFCALSGTDLAYGDTHSPVLTECLLLYGTELVSPISSSSLPWSSPLSRCPRCCYLRNYAAIYAAGNAAISGRDAAIHRGNAAIYGGNAAVYGTAMPFPHAISLRASYAMSGTDIA
eukprot:114510-Rhodomonas_salina.1